ncbi:AraC family transcriptional regulator [Sphingomonas zeicaulis]|uniref:helix-turn-helix domain-containing protein n=1 Tax=Sphingomonas zeicaulis TaxID=1632740 RepID=UPI003D1EE5E3
MTLRTAALGAVSDVARDRHVAAAGLSFHRSRTLIGHRTRYSSISAQHQLYVTLDGATAYSAGRIDRASWDRAPDAPDIISFTPAGRNRSSILGRGWIECAHICLDPDRLAEACQVDRIPDWSALYNGRIPKIAALARAIDGAAAQAAPQVEIDRLAIALQRGLAIALGGVTPRRDDAWLHPRALRRVCSYIEDHLADALPLADLAREAGLGPSAFLRAFRGSTGVTPGRYVMQRRVARAAALLTGTDAPVAWIAARTGFASAAHLTNLFRQRLGSTPARFRREIEILPPD